MNKTKLIAIVSFFGFFMGLIAETSATSIPLKCRRRDGTWYDCSGYKKPPNNENCTPCLYGCVDNECSSAPLVNDEGMPWSAIEAVELGEKCYTGSDDRSTYGACTNDYQWICDNLSCYDSDEVIWWIISE